MGTMLTVPTEGDSEFTVFSQRGTALRALSEKGYALSTYRGGCAHGTRGWGVGRLELTVPTVVGGWVLRSWYACGEGLHLLVLTGIDELH